MSAQDLHDALEAPDIDTSHEQLFRIIAHGVGPDAASPTTVEAYLRAFCDSKSSFSRRRWIGITLCKMLQSSPEVVAYLKRPTQSLTGIGEVILTTDEREETKIVAGLVMREGLARGINFLSFWPNDKVQQSVSHFPRDAGPRWMDEYQQYLEMLVAVAITDRVNDCSLCYVVSLTATDGYRREPNDALSVLIVQREQLTVLTADPMLQDIAFVDVPLSNIRSVCRKRSVLHDSQGQQTKLKPWDVILRLSGSWTYRVNSSQRAGREVTIIFKSEDDAMECENSINDYLCRPQTASTNPLSIDQSPDAEPEQERAARVEQRRQRALADLGEAVACEDNISASAEETGSNTGSVIRASTTTLEPQETFVSGRASVRKSTVLRNAEVEMLSSPPVSKSASSRLHAGASSARSMCGASVIETQKQFAPSKSGALPMVKEPASSSVNTQRLPFGQKADVMFEFPEQSPRIERPGNASTANSFAKLNSTSNKLKVLKEVTKARPIGPKPKPKPKTQRSGVKDTQDEDRTRVRASSLRPGAHDIAPKAQASSSSAAVPSSSLPKIAKPHGAQSASIQPADSDVFAIPQDEDTGAKPRAKRTRARTVAYKELETSEDEVSESEYTEKKRRKTRSPAKRSLAVKRSRSKPPLTLSARTTMKGSKHVKSSGGEAQSMNFTKPPLLSQLVPRSKVSKAHSKPARDGKENVTPTTSYAVESPKLANAMALGSEIDILDKLNKHKDEHKHTASFIQGSEHKAAVVSRKRVAESSPPATPSRVKRTKTISTLLGHGIEQDDVISVKPPTTIAPLRVLSDPSSPCGKSNQRSSNHSNVESNKSMRAPAKPNVDQNTSVAPHSQRRHIADSRKRIDKRHTPMHQHRKQRQTGGSANVELLSSNSKPTPASPRAESTAISGHADPARMNIEREMGVHEIEKNDPFNRRSNPQRLTSFTRRLTRDEQSVFDEAKAREGASFELPIELGDSESSSDTSSEADFEAEPPMRTREPAPALKSRSLSVESPRVRQSIKYSRGPTVELSEPPNKALRSVDVAMDDLARSSSLQLAENTEKIDSVFPANDVTMDGDTFIEQESEQVPNQKQSPVLFGSSPPPLDGSPSSHSSTSAEAPEPRTDPPVPASETDEMEWESSLQPHQRSLHDELLRVSTRVMRHVVDNETAIAGIADTYARDGKHLLDTLVDRYNGEFTAMFKDVDKKKGKMISASEQLLQKLGKDSKALDGR
jgi:hypothetical protein